jgi:hypothetical protein
VRWKLNAKSFKLVTATVVVLWFLDYQLSSPIAYEHCLRLFSSSAELESNEGKLQNSRKDVFVSPA